jgi:crotonobetaine/carnitine-CoA ligase
VATLADLITKTPPEIVAVRAGEAPDRIFLQDAVSGGAWSYGEVHDSGLRWAAAYLRAGVAAGDRVLTMLSSRVEYLLSWLGVAWLKAADVPINTEYRGAMLRHIADSSGARVLLVEDRYVRQVLEVLPELRSVEQVVVVGDTTGLIAEPGGAELIAVEKFLAGAGPLEDPEPPGLHDVGSVLYTSGTTGPSKGVLQPWGQIRRNVVCSFPLSQFGPDDAFYLSSPIYHQAGKLIPDLVALGGGRFVFREKFSASGFWSDVRRFHCTWSTLVGVMAPFLMALEPDPSDADNPLRQIFVIPVPSDVEGFMRRFDVEVMTVYGMTEISVPFSSVGYRLTNANAASCGRLTPGCEVRIVDELDAEVAEGEVGELIVRADEPWVMNLGYLGEPEATVAAWRNGWFHTGDAFRRDQEGYYYFVDRMKDAIRRRGENVSSFEVESIVNTHPLVAASAAVAVPSEYGEDEIKVCVVLRDGAALRPEELIDHLVPIMPAFMVPRYLEFVDDLPRTPTQRIMKAELRRRAMTPATWDRQSVSS